MTQIVVLVTGASSGLGKATTELLPVKVTRLLSDRMIDGIVRSQIKE